MDTLLEALMNPAEMTRPQLLMLVILLFVVIASLYFVWRLYRILTTARKTPYVPNIGLKRTGTRPGSGEALRQPGTDNEAGSGNAVRPDNKRPD